MLKTIHLIGKKKYECFLTQLQRFTSPLVLSLDEWRDFDGWVCWIDFFLVWFCGSCEWKIKHFSSWFQKGFCLADAFQFFLNIFFFNFWYTVWPFLIPCRCFTAPDYVIFEHFFLTLYKVNYLVLINWVCLW